MMCNEEELFYGSVTVGERGQIVIPAQARSELNVQPGDKLLVMRHPIHKGLMLVQFQHMQEFLEGMKQSLEKARDQITEDEPE